MNRIVKIALIIAGILVLLLIVAGSYGVSQLRRPFPQTDGTITLAGLSGEVHIYRDESGIPHIYAENLDDLYFAQGYVTAQDRFWQMDWWRHQGQGRVAELIGEAGVEPDKFIRTAGWHRMTENTVAYYQTEEPEYYKNLESYAAGVNAYIGDKEAGDLSVTHALLQTVNEPWEIEPWTPANTISWGVVMSFVLANDIDRELAYADLIAEFGEDVVFQLRPEYPYHNRPVIAPTSLQTNKIGAAMGGGGETAVEWQNVNSSIIGVMPDNILGAGPYVGSNNWVISGEHTPDGLPLLANDPHLAIQLPAIWYEVSLHAPDFDVAGFSFAGVPGVVIGHNNHIAWGVTNSGPDVLDLYIEKINPDNPNQYEWMGEWRDMEMVEEVIKVNGGEDVVITVRSTQHGPVISDNMDDRQDVLAMRWAAQEPSRVLQSMGLLNRAQNYDDFLTAASYWDIPSQNIVYADTEGNIAYQMPGLVPIRKNGIGIVPSPGWNGEYEWEGWVPFEELPALFNPEKGYIVTANHAIVDEEYPHYIKRDWADGDRGQRIEDMMETALADGQVTQEEIGRMQSDSFSLPAETYLPLLTAVDTQYANVQAAIHVLEEWNMQERGDSVGATIFELFYLRLPMNILADEIGEENVAVISNNIFLHQIANDPDAIWWDNVNTPEKETREDIIRASLEEAMILLDELLEDAELEEAYWGYLHTATFVSDPLGQSGIGLIETLVNRGPFPVDGGNNIVNANGWDRDNPAEVDWHPSMRMIVNMADFDASQAILPTGQSGHPNHPHYDDMMPLWISGDYHPMWWSRENVEAAAADHLVLRP